LYNVQIMLHSGIGKPYDARNNTGVVGRNFTQQITSTVQSFFDNKNFNPFIAAGAIGMCIDDYNGDNFDHGPHGFVGGGYMGMVQPNARPILTTPVPPGTPAWGAGWKKAIKDNYLSSILPATHGSHYSYRQNYLDLDPTHTDRFGRPMMRLTMDFYENEHKMTTFLTDKLAEIVQKMGARQAVKAPRLGHYSSVPYQTTHTCGGAVMGTDPTTSALNRYLQSWDVPNVFVMGATAFPQNAGYNPTGTVGALAYWAADAIKTQYLKNPGPLVHA
jgi:gluconate 2-dehydrogenase alpha chain